MGKGNRTRNERATDTLASIAAPRRATKKQGMPTWVGTLIVVAVLALLVLFVTFVVLNSRGTFQRMRTFAETEHYEVSVPMMSYMVASKYQSTISMYDQYSTQFGANIQIGGGEGGNSLDKTKSLREQIYSSTTDAAGNVTQKTWFDYFAEAAEKDVLNYLACCEEARLNGMKLDKEDKDFINEQLDAIEQYAAQNGYSTNGYVSLLYGQGVILKDVRNMLKIMKLATKWSDFKAEAFFDGVSNDRMEEYYAANKSTYDVYCDYIGYSFTTSFEPSDNTDTAAAATENATAAAKYQEEQARFAAYVEELSQITDEVAFRAKLKEFFAAEERLKREAEKGSALDEVEIAGCDQLASVKLSDSTFTNKSADDEGEGEEELYKWLFESKTENGVTIYLRATGDVKKFEDTEKAYEDPAEGSEIEYQEAISTYTIGYFKKGMHRNTDLVRSVGHILFKDDTLDGLTSTDKLSGVTKELADKVLARDGMITAYAVAGELLDMLYAEGKITEQTRQDGSKYYVIDKSVFEQYGEQYTEDSNVFYENISRNENFVQEYKDWLFDAVRVEGEISYPEPVKTQYGYHIMYYVGNEIESWKSDIRNDLSEADNTAYLESILTTHPATINRNYYRYINL